MKIISWIGTIASIAGAFLMAFGMAQYGYIAFSIGSVSCLYVAISKRDMPLIILNGTFFIANIIGLYRAFV
jgi:hypothetical protein